MPDRTDRRLSRRPDDDDGDDEFTADALALADAITAARRMTLQDIFKLGDLLEKAKSVVPSGRWREFISEHLPLKAGIVRRLGEIASDKRLRQESRATRLPICLYAIWELTTLTDEQFDRGIQADAINPSMLRANVEPLKGRWVPGANISPRMAPRTISYNRRRAKPDPVMATRVAYFNATIELSADENERELAACHAHFRHVGDDDDD